MKIENLSISDVKVLTPKVFADARGYFAETWKERLLAEAGISARFVQDNQAMSVDAGTVRGLHFQLPPRAQDKLVRVSKGAILDVAVDVRRGSATFGQHVTRVLSSENWCQMWVPKGFAHGYVTLEPHTEVIYKVTDFYAPDCDAGIAWDDPDLGIDWGVEKQAVILSAKDKALPRLADAGPLF
jgi:dTDP-4-dehydrorhamnose 3,5-epimerase